MDSAALPFLTIAEVAALVETRHVSPVELTQALLKRIETVDSRLNTYITVSADEALLAAQEAEKEIRHGQYRGPLHGIPVALKDVIATKGVRTTCGSKILSDWVPDDDATVVQRLKTAGAVIIGKNNAHEFAAGPSTNNPHFGACRNPWNMEHVPGGSSGGSGAAVAASLCFGSLGTDTGGSVRTPASLCGVVGLKPTCGVVSRYGVFPLSWSLDSVGPLARSVKDAALLLQAIAGYDSKDPSSVNVSVPNYASALDGNVKGLRVGVPREHFFQETAGEVADVVSRAIRVLEGLGSQVKEVSIPLARYCSTAANTIIWTEAASIHEGWLRSRPEDYGADVLLRLQVGALVPATCYHRAQRLMRLIREQFREVFTEVDVLLSATNPVPAPRIGQQVVTAANGSSQPMGGTRGAMSLLTWPYNVAGLAAISVPCGFTKTGLPVGLQFGGRAFDELTILRIGHAYEQSTIWHNQRPQI